MRQNGSAEKKDKDMTRWFGDEQIYNVDTYGSIYSQIIIASSTAVLSGWRGTVLRRQRCVELSTMHPQCPLGLGDGAWGKGNAVTGGQLRGEGKIR